MKKYKNHLLFLIVWALLFLLRLADLTSSLLEFRVIQGREQLMHAASSSLPPPEKDITDQLREEKAMYLQGAALSGLEVSMLAILCLCYLRARQVANLVSQSASARVERMEA